MRILNPTRSRAARGSTLVAGLVVAAGLAGCDSLLEVTDPDLVVPEAITNPDLFWAGAIGDFMDAYSDADGVATYVGLFTDEFELSGTFPTRLEVDERNVQKTNGTMEGVFRQLHAARVGAENAADLLAQGEGGDSRIAELYSLAGYTYVFFGEVYCSGVPFGTTGIGAGSTQGEPVDRDGTFQLAMSRFDQALAATDGNTHQQRLASVGKARALLNLGQFDQAAAAVAGIPDDWEYLVRHDINADGGTNGIYSQNVLQGRWTVADGEGGNGIMFRSANDPRLPWQVDPDGVGFDSQTTLYNQLIWGTEGDDMPLASGTEVRLIRAEAALRGGDPGGWLTILNALRTDAGMTALADPGSSEARERLHFEERAFWLFGRGYRLGDLRRMIRQYGYTESEVFPTGAHFKGSNYGTDVNLPIPEDEENNPNFTACIDRSA